MGGFIPSRQTPCVTMLAASLMGTAPYRPCADLFDVSAEFRIGNSADFAHALEACPVHDARGSHYLNATCEDGTRFQVWAGENAWHLLGQFKRRYLAVEHLASLTGKVASRYAGIVRTVQGCA